jgi:hypothetical protein
LEYKEILIKSLESDKYYDNTDLRMNRNYNFMLNNKELDEYLRFKEDYECNSKILLPLLSWNSKNIYLYKSKELESKINDYFEFFKNDNNTLVQKEVLLGIFIFLISEALITIYLGASSHSKNVCKSSSFSASLSNIIKPLFFQSSTSEKS